MPIDLSSSLLPLSRRRVALQASFLSLLVRLLLAPRRTDSLLASVLFRFFSLFLAPQRRGALLSALLLSVAAIPAGAASAVVYSPAEYGAAMDGRANDGPALQRAIDAAAAAGGGVVIVPAGRTLRSGGVQLRSRLTLRLEPGSRLVASTDPSDYRDPILLSAIDAEELVIEGSGTIDGQALRFVAREEPDGFRMKPWRPKLMILEHCRRVRLRDFTIVDSPNWTVHLAGCDDVAVHALTIRNDLRVPNCDGIDPDHSRNVRISDCHIEAADDCIVIKALPQYARYGPCENIAVTGCTLVSKSAALKIGTETVADIRNIVFSNCVVRGSHRGVAIVLRDQGNIEDVLVQNLTIETRLFPTLWWGAAEPIYVSVAPRAQGVKNGRIRGLRFQQIVATGEGGVFLEGLAAEDAHLKEVVFDGVVVRRRTPAAERIGRVDTRPGPGVEPRWLPPAGFRLRQAADVTLRGCRVEWLGERPAAAVDFDATAVSELARLP